MSDTSRFQTRRGFIKTAATAAIGVAAVPLFEGTVRANGETGGVAIVLSPDDSIARQTPVRWAADHLQSVLKTRGVSTQIYDAPEQAPAGWQCLVVAGRSSAAAREVLEKQRVVVADAAEALALVPGKLGGRNVLLASGTDARGMVYAVLELADRASFSTSPVTALREVKTVSEKPANRIRSVARLFTSDIEDKPWFNDRAFWQEYLTMLATQRFNRFNLTLGIGYDFTTNIRDGYFYFAYPFLVSVPGYDVEAVPLPDEERKANLDLLRFISDEAVRRGLHFQLGIWTHAYKWTNSPRVNYSIKGLTDEQQGPYCRDALRMVLEACPSIGGVTMRIHGESGVPEGSYDFWRTVFDGMVKCGRPVELDMHAKGMDQPTIDVALATGLPVNISPKYWAEHMGLPYMQTAIRQQEMPPRNARNNGFFAQSSGSRSFLRYGYGDLLTEGRKYGVIHRIWPGTQRVLVWGDPLVAAAYGRSFGFCGSDGFELFEPLSFKGRKGSGLPGGRDSYADETLKTSGGSWEKYLYTYRIWGRLTYNPDSDPDGWRRLLRQEFGSGAGSCEAALANASRILPLVTTAHCPSAANNTYWPEIYLNMPIVDANRPHPYGDTPSPRRFGTVSPLDPGLFSTIDEYAGLLLKGEQGAKYSPAEVAERLQNLAQTSAKHLASFQSKASSKQSPEFRRIALDTAIQCQLGLFFAWKFRSGVLYALFLKTKHQPAVAEALNCYRKARAAWAELAEKSKGIYATDITYGYATESRGNWADRLPAIDADIGDMEKKLGGTRDASETKTDPKVIAQAMADVLAPPRRASVTVGHQPPKPFRRGDLVTIEASAALSASGAVHLHYRRVNQAETWRVVEMQYQAGRWSAMIPADYADSPFPLQYYFELRTQPGAVCLHPGLGRNLTDQPCFVVRQA